MLKQFVPGFYFSFISCCASRLRRGIKVMAAGLQATLFDPMALISRSGAAIYTK